MSNHLVSATYKRTLGSAMRKAVMAVLADKASDDGSGIYAAKQTIADELDCSKRAVIETIRGFEQDGLLRVLGHRKVTNGYVVEYGIDVARLLALPLHAAAERQVRQDNRCAKVTGAPASLVNEAHVTGEPPAPKPPLNPSPVQASPSQEDEPAAPEQPKLLPEHILDVWNDLASRLNLPKAKKTPERLKALRIRIRAVPIEDWTEAINAVERSAFLQGQNDRGFRANFDFLLRPSSFTKLVEGFYDGTG